MPLKAKHTCGIRAPHECDAFATPVLVQDDLKEEDAPGGFLLEGVLPTAQQQQEAAAGPTEQDQDTVPQPTR